MSLYEIEIYDEKIVEQINTILNKILNDEIYYRYSNTSREISAAVKELVYSHKDEIIDKCVSKATTELVKKGLPKLIENLKGSE